MEQPARRPRRRRPRICQRETCERLVPSPTQRHCTALCRVIDREQAKAQRVCEAIGHTPATTELWTSLVDMADTLSRYQELDEELHETARSVGITEEQWRAIKSS